MSIDNSTGKTKGFYERGQAIFDRIPKGEEMKISKPEVNHMNLIDLEALVLHHGQQIRDIAEHLLKLRKWGSPMLEKKEWVGLTDFELGGLSVSYELRHIETSLLVKYVRRIEAKLKEKNGG